MILNDECKYTVYYHQNKINGKFYVGITSQKVERRWRSDGSGYNKNCLKMYRAIQKYGWDNFYHEIFASGLTEDEALTMEAILIEKLDSINNGYNIYPGGAKRDAESVRKNSEGHKGLKVGYKNPRATGCFCEEDSFVSLTIDEMCEHLHCNRNRLSEVLHGHRKTIKGFHVRFATKEEIENIKAKRLSKE